jgi:excisionase family DNA binding protein
METPSLRQCIGYREASRVLALPVGTLRSMVCRRQIPHIRVSPRIVLFDPEALRAWLEHNSIGVANENRRSAVVP